MIILDSNGHVCGGLEWRIVLDTQLIYEMLHGHHVVSVLRFNLPSGILIF